jgi:hypothetical protein
VVHLLLSVFGENLISIHQGMNKAEIRQVAEDLLSDPDYKADLNEIHDRTKLAKLIDNVLVRLAKTTRYFDNDYDRDYTEYRVTQVLALGSKDRWGEMRANEIVAWSRLLDIDVLEFLKAGAGADKLTLRQASILYKIETGENLILETVESLAA